MAAYYNEIVPHAAAWLRNLIAAGLIAPGDVDERDIRDVTPADLAGYTQCHFFAGIGLWSHALRRAGWPDDRPVWTGSCPCQPFSQAGKGAGFADERHLWPAWHWLISQCRPGIIFGEQVEGSAGRAWLDLVSTDLEAGGYACGPVVFPSASVGAPNIRHRLYWVADATGHGLHQQRRKRGEPESAREFGRHQSAYGVETGGLADANGGQRGWLAGSSRSESNRPQAGRQQGNCESEHSGATGRLADAEGRGRGEHGLLGQALGGRQDTGQSALGDEIVGRLGDTERVGLEGGAPAGRQDTSEGRQASERPTGFSSGPHHPWRELEWIACTDGKVRSTQPGLFPLAPRNPGDVAKLRAYGNAINPVVATEFIRAYLECRPEAPVESRG